ncbi:MAG: hypothetical protein ABFC38_03710 [Methanospirillum sp.]
MGFYQIAYEVEGFTVGQLREMLSGLEDTCLLLPVSTESPFSDDVRYIRVMREGESGIFEPIGILAPENDRMITQEELEGEFEHDEGCDCDECQ